MGEPIDVCTILPAAIDTPLFQQGANYLGPEKGSFVGVDPRIFPRDFAVFVRYYQDIKKVPARYPMPGPMALEQLQDFLDQHGERYPVQWLDM